MTDLKCKVLKISVLGSKKCKLFFITCRRRANLYLLAFCIDIIQNTSYFNKKDGVKKRLVCFSFHSLYRPITFQFNDIIKKFVYNIKSAAHLYVMQDRNN